MQLEQGHFSIHARSLLQGLVEYLIGAYRIFSRKLMRHQAEAVKTASIRRQLLSFDQ